MSLIEKEKITLINLRVILMKTAHGHEYLHNNLAKYLANIRTYQKLSIRLHKWPLEILRQPIHRNS